MSWCVYTLFLFLYLKHLSLCKYSLYIILVSWLFASSGQSIRASASVLPVNIQGWLPLGLTDLMSLLSKGLSRVFSSTKSLKASVLQHSAFFTVQLSNLYMTTGKTIAFTVWTFLGKVMSLLLNTLSLSYPYVLLKMLRMNASSV